MPKTPENLMSGDFATGRLPLHVEISEMLAREIQAGILVDGTRLAAERSMAVELGVSVGTLRKALSDLEQKGLLERVQGSGNYVRSAGNRDHSKSTIYNFFRLELVEGGGLPTAEVLAVNRLKSPKSCFHFLHKSSAARIRRLRRLNGLDAALEEIWVDAPAEAPVTRESLSDSLYLFYKEQLGFWITRAEDSIGVEATPDWRPDGFGSQKAGKRWGYVERNGYDQNNRCVEFSRTWYDPDTTRYIARWR